MKRVAVAAFVWLILTMVLVTVATALLWAFRVGGWEARMSMLSLVSCCAIGCMLGGVSWHIAGELVPKKDHERP